MIKLSTGHTFADGVVKAISPIEHAELWDGEDAFDTFTIIGEGFTVVLSSDDLWDGFRKANKEKRTAFAQLHKEAIEKLIK